MSQGLPLLLVLCRRAAVPATPTVYNDVCCLLVCIHKPLVLVRYLRRLKAALGPLLPGIVRSRAR